MKAINHWIRDISENNKNIQEGRKWKKDSILGFTIFLMFFLLFISENKAESLSNDSTVMKVYQLDIMEEIAPPVWHLTQKAFEEANNGGYDLVIIHMNTYGGMVDAADSIRTAILNSDIPVYVLIDNNAAINNANNNNLLISIQLFMYSVILKSS